MLSNTSVHIVLQVMSNLLVSPLLGLVLPLQWNHPFLASLLAVEQASLLLQKAGLNKRPGYISAVFNFLRSWKHHRKSSWNLLLCPLRFSWREIPLCLFFYSCQKYCFALFIGPVGGIWKFYSQKFRGSVIGVGPGWDAPTSCVSYSIRGPRATIESACLTYKLS